MPDEYDAVRRRLTNYEKGLYFELGRAHELGETPEKGWAHHFRIETKDGPRVLDSARTQGRGVQGVERKSGRVNEVDARAQLRKDRDGLNSGRITHARWETVAGEKIPDKVREDLRDMARDFGDKFQHVIISRADALRAMQLGRSLASKQLELIRPYELQRADRARERLAKIRQIVRAQERAEQFRKMQQFREAAARGRADAPQVERDRQARAEAERARQARQTPETERARIEREAAERVAQEFPVPSQYQERETADTAEQVARESADAASVEREAAEARATAAEKEREAAFKALDEARNAAFKELDEKGRLSEVERLLWLGQAHHPQAAVRHPPGQAPSVVRGGTGHGQDRARGITRDR
ncbi:MULTISPECIES: hypothetical protein [Nocardia]|uniref:Uncharacterized protein n=1 Tax=Nocardia implantans TaxID=3108168 RepID=A0ABU6ATG5_9NOCA|nr:MULTISPECIES: hypothetical protein [unclassified Nocardia]MBF6190805.1 hypothetical protein [Nocardia beijingensis]MEA3528794.1 hypothetical protein [Nocardia sp. CDC192]MEB3510459.1 hypothetical protein [Nocardia sp. CDC186]